MTPPRESAALEILVVGQRRVSSFKKKFSTFSCNNILSMNDDLTVVWFGINSEKIQ